MRRARLLAVALPAAALAAVLAACHQPPQDAPEPRPALTTVVHADGAVGTGDRAFVGTIEPRYSTQLAFRVGGKIVRRSVSIGDHVKRGQEIAALDRRSLELAVAASAADLSGGAAQRANADTTFGRQTALRAQNSVAQTSLDEARTSQAAALAMVNQAQARLHKAQEDLGYGVLHSELDGVVTRIDFEVEQVVAANEVIAEVARPDVLDLVLDVPESAAQALQIGDPFTVRSQQAATGDTPGFAAKVRQLNPAADRTTRTRRVWIALDGAPPEVRLGATMYAVRAATAPAPLRVPLTALLDGSDAGASSVWIVDGDALQSRLVTLGARSPDDAVVLTGIHDGERILTAGVHSVTAGQRIKLDQVTAP